MIEGAKIFVTGGTGSWGVELVRQLLKLSAKEIIVFSRNESNQVAMSREFDHPALHFVIGDIRDKDAVLSASRGADLIFHLAALKHVPVCEEQPYEALKTNVIGMQNVIDAALENSVKKVMNVSTDKAANPSNFYGMTKAIAEKLMIYANLLPGPTKFLNVRGGNVLGTSESVVQLFKQQIQQKGQVRITHKAMTRFFLTKEDAVHRLLLAAEKGIGGEIFIMTMPSCRIIDLAEVLIAQSGKPDVEIVETGVRPGEKLSEVLVSEYESQHTIAFDEHFLVTLPALNIPGLAEAYQGYSKADSVHYESSSGLMSKQMIQTMLQKGGFLS